MSLVGDKISTSRSLAERKLKGDDFSDSKIFPTYILLSLSSHEQCTAKSTTRGAHRLRNARNAHFIYNDCAAIAPIIIQQVDERRRQRAATEPMIHGNDVQSNPVASREKEKERESFLSQCRRDKRELILLLLPRLR